MRNNYYYLQENENGDLQVHYVTPCNELHIVAYIPANERDSVNPPVVWLTKACGINGVIKIALLLAEERLTNL
jgi:hypothetical protein